MSDIDAQFAVGIDQAMLQLGEDSTTYTRSDSGASLSIRCMLVAPDYLVSRDDSPVPVSADCWDALIRSADLVFATVRYEPKAGDLLAVTAHGSTRTYEVMVDLRADGRHACWTWADHQMIRRRVRVKLITATGA